MVDCIGFENRRNFAVTEGSNPSLSGLVPTTSGTFPWTHGPSTPKRPISILSIFDYYERRLLTYTSKSRASTTEQGIVVQLVRAPPCHGGSCGFESRQSRFHISLKSDSSRTDRTEAHPIEVGVVLVAHA